MKIRDKRKKGWFIVDNEYLNGYARHLGVNCTVVYLSLCRHVDVNNQTCFPSMELISEENGIHKTTVIRAIKKLEEKKIISVKRDSTTRKEGHQMPNIYTLLDKSEWKKEQSSRGQPCGRVAENTEQGSSECKSRVAQDYCKETHLKDTQLRRLGEKIIPEYINSISWKDWVDYRKERGKTLTNRTIKLQWKFLNDFTKSNQNKIINESIKNGWTGLFKLKEKSGIKRKITFSKHYENS